MRALIQRTDEASVTIEHKQKAAIGPGMVILLGIEHADTQSDVEYLCRKIARLRIFDDPSGVMNLDIKQSQGQVMVVSQFTLHADCSRGNRPSYINAARPEQALPLYELFLEQLSVECSQEVACGTFGATMFIKMVANGPVTILIDSKNR